MSKNVSNVEEPATDAQEAPEPQEDSAEVFEEFAAVNDEDAASGAETDPETDPETPSGEEDSVDAGADDPAPASDVSDEVERLRDELAQTKEQLLRQMAEFQNFRRRKEREHQQLLLLGQTQVLRPLLDVLDDFRRSLEAAAQVEQQQEEAAGPAYQALKEGVEMVYQKFSDELEKLGVEPIEAVGQPFDEHLHDAMMQQPAPDDDTPEGTVLDELQRGYRLGDRVLRHSKVIVAG